MKKFSEFLGEHTMKTINFRKKKNNKVINKWTAEIMKMQISVKFAKKSMTINMLKIENALK